MQRPEIMATWLQDMYLQLGLSSEEVRLFVRRKGPDSLERLSSNNNVDDIYNVVGKPGGKNADGTLNRGCRFWS